MLTGTVKFFNADKGYGFIAAEDGSGDSFVHITALERSVVACAAGFGIEAGTRPGAPGVYVGGAKLASVGIRIRRGASYHGLAVNVNMDLAPFHDINPCGYAGLAVTQLADLGIRLSMADATDVLATRLADALGRATH